jgi:repressor LexA
MRRETLTRRRREVLAAIDRTIRQRGYPPTVREIGEALGLRSTSSVHFHLKALQDLGYLKRDGSLTRALTLQGKSSDVVRRSAEVLVPLVGRVAAGEPIFAAENVEDTLPLPAQFVGEGPSFMLEVKGESMIEDGILDGDYVIVTKTSTAENGDTVVALLDDEATVKRWYRHADHVELRPANATMQPIMAREVEVIGRVCGVLRVLKH